MNINKLGEKLVLCKLNCEGITNDPSQGIIPRCLYLEERGLENGVIIVGLNPGKASEKEKSFFLNQNISYNLMDKCWKEMFYNYPYYKKLRNILLKLGYTGNILWTELVKCECSGKNGDIPIQTMRTCINNYLKKEIEEIFKSYTIFAIGNRAFDFCALSFPNRFVIGVPHPTGSYGTFDKLNKNVKNDNERYKKILANTKDNNGNYRAIKLFS